MSTNTVRHRRHLAPEAIDAILRAAIRAPSAHNTQPWIFALEPGAIHLRADRTRAVAIDDRELTMSCGAALFNLRVAAWHAGASPAIELLSDERDPDLLATIALHGGNHPPADLERLYAAIPRRRSNHDGFAGTMLPTGLADELTDCANAAGVCLEFLADERRARVAELIARADHDRRRHRGLSSWMHRRPVGSSGMLGVLATHHDGPRDWLVAGMALEQVLLHAASEGVQASSFNQPIELAGLRTRVAALLDGPCFPQAIVVLGRPAHQPVASPRRPLADVIEAAA